MQSIWNEKYLFNGKLVKPDFLRDWVNGLPHFRYAARRRKFSISALVALASFSAYFSSIGIENIDRWFYFAEQFVLMFIACPVILSAWADMKDDELKVFEVNLSKLSLKMFLMNSLYKLIVGLGAFLLVLPGIWLATVFSMSMIILCVDNSGFFLCFKRSFELVRGSFYDVAVYIVFWAFLFALGTVVVLLIPGSLSVLFIPDSMNSIVLFFTGFVTSILGLFFQLTFLPPMVYMFAYLTEKKLHKK